MSKLVNILGSAFAVAAVLAATAASAWSDQDPTGVTVRYGDLNLARAADARRLLFRVRSAARLACGGEPEMGWWEARRDYDHCVEAAVSSAVDKIGAASLSDAAHPIRVAGR